MNYKKRNILDIVAASYFVRVRNQDGRWVASIPAHSRILERLRGEADLPATGPDPDDAYDRLLTAAGRLNLGLETEEPNNE